MKVKDIMTKEVISVKKKTSLKEAAGILAKMRIHGMPVVDDKEKVIGVITESDFFTKDSSNIFLPTFLDFINKEKADLNENDDSSDLDQKSEVEDIMTSECETVPPELSLDDLILMFKTKNYNSFPVVDERNVLVGIVTIMDVIRLL
jgi:CBS domain-containing protein